MLGVPVETLPLEHITNKFFADYVHFSGKAAIFFSSHFTDFKPRRVKVEREKLVNVLLEVNRGLKAPEEVITNILSLRKSDVYLVVTGQQPGLFTGPLYTIYKAVTAVVIAEKLSREGIKLVPGFWNASEDHDVQEVNHIYLLRENKPEKIIYKAKGNGKPYFNIEIDLNEVSRCIEEINSILPNTEFKGEIMETLFQLAEQSKDLADYFSRLMLHFFGGKGLIIIDPRYMRDLMVPVFRKAIEEPMEINRVVNFNWYKMKDLGYSPQIHKRMEICNFYLVLGGRRVRVVFKGRFKVGGHVFSKDEMLDLLESEPERFSANALLRPITQDYTLPTAILVAGPHEIVYLAQVLKAYRLFNLEPPVVFPRFGATVVEGKVLKVLRKYDLTVLELKKPFEVINRLVSGEIEDKFMAIKGSIEETLKELKRSIKKEKNLSVQVEITEKKIMREVDRLKAQFVKSLKRRDRVMKEQVFKASNNLFPLGFPQERKINVLEYLVRYGYSFIEELRLGFKELNFGEHLVFYPGKTRPK